MSRGFKVGASWVDVDVKNRTVHGFVDDPGCGQAVAAQAGDEGLCAPVTKRSLGFEACANPGASAKPGHLRRGAGLVEEDQPIDLGAQARLARCRPVKARLLHIDALGLAGQECSPPSWGQAFLNEKPAWIRTRDKDAG
jgi:hypothetical protein